MAMTQESRRLSGGGRLLGMAYFDYFYNLVLIVVIAKVILRSPPPSRSLASASFNIR
jgi:hypothetical protein